MSDMPPQFIANCRLMAVINCRSSGLKFVDALLRFVFVITYSQLQFKAMQQSGDDWWFVKCFIFDPYLIQ